MKKVKKLLLFVLLFSGFLFISLQRQSEYQQDDWKTEFAADKGGYYIYLPATFIYGFSDKKINQIDTVKYSGIHLVDHKIKTKYPYGTALLQLPFFITAHLYAHIFNYPTDGFSKPYRIGINSAGCFYLLLGLFFIFQLLIKYFSVRISILAIVTLLFGSNLLYYGIDETGMSHIYSFCLFSSLLLFVEKYRNTNHFSYFFVCCLLIALITAVRNLNIVFALAILLFWKTESMKTAIQDFISTKQLMTLAAVCIVFILPHAIYLYFVFDTPTIYSYQQEGFEYWNNPKLLPLWFAPLNGLFSYCPNLLFAVLGLFWMYKKKKNNTLLILFIFLTLSYLYASWYSWHLGVGFSGRWIVEFLPLMLIPLCYFIKWLKNQHPIINYSVTVIIIAGCLFTSKMAWSHNKFFDGKTWEWQEYIYVFNENNFIKLPKENEELVFDFKEQVIQMKEERVPFTKNIVTNKLGVYDCSSDNEYCLEFLIPFSTLQKQWKRISVTFDYKGVITGKDTKFVIAYLEDDKQTQYKQFSINDELSKTNDWQQTNLKGRLPAYTNKEVMKLYIWNLNKNHFQLQNLKIRFE